MKHEKHNISKSSEESIKALLLKIQTEEGHDRNIAIESLVKVCDAPEIVVPILIEALGDLAYGFCEYEGCVESAASYLLKYKDYIKEDTQRDSILSVLIDDIEYELDSCLPEPDIYVRIELLEIFGKKAERVLPRLKKWLSFLLEDDPLAINKNTKILKKTVEAIQKGIKEYNDDND